MTLSSFLTFLTFLPQTLCFSASASDPWQGWKSHPTLAASALGRRP
jgi:hypothetical protein